MSAPVAPGRAATTPPVGVVVVNFGSHRLLADHLPRLGPLPGGGPVVVVDNLHSSAERRSITALAATCGWELLCPTSNLGFGEAANLGAGEVFARGCRAVLLLNPDVVLDAEALVALLAAAEAQPDTIMSPRLVHPDGSTWFCGAHVDERTGLTSSSPADDGVASDRWLTAACLLVPRAAWEGLGGFDPHYFLYWEDLDLTRRHLAAGGRLSVLHEVTAEHDVGGTQAGAGKSPTYCYFMCRNRLQYAALRLGRRARLDWLRHSPTHLRRVALRSGGRRLLRDPRPATAALRGTLAGTALVLRSLVRSAPIAAPSTARADLASPLGTPGTIR